jgi:predicted alpha/beta-fold hydrolase
VLVGLPDGDRVVLHDSQPAEWQVGGPMALLVHGMGGDHRSGYMQRVTQLFLQRGWRAVRMDQRGCGRGVGLARRPYNAGRSDDVRAAVAEVRRWSPESPVTVIGFSLGGNVILKLAGEAADIPLPGLALVVAVAPPIDLEKCAVLLAQPRNRIYDQFFVRELLLQVRQNERCSPGSLRTHFRRPLTVRKFDEVYTAPRSGFADALDYYRRSSSAPLLPRIHVPTLILTARDDPFIAVEPFEAAKTPSHVTIKIVRHGGHLGFLGRDGAGGVRWAEHYLTEWVTNGPTC